MKYYFGHYTFYKRILHTFTSIHCVTQADKKGFVLDSIVILENAQMVICFRPLDEKIMTHVGEPIAMMVDTAYTSYNSQLSPR